MIRRYDDYKFYVMSSLFCGLIYTLYWGITMVNEKKDSMMSYMRSMGMMVNARPRATKYSARLMCSKPKALERNGNLLGYLPSFFIMSLLAAFFEELSGRAFGWEAYRNQPWMVLMDNQLTM